MDGGNGDEALLSSPFDLSEELLAPTLCPDGKEIEEENEDRRDGNRLDQLPSCDQFCVHFWVIDDRALQRSQQARNPYSPERLRVYPNHTDDEPEDEIDDEKGAANRQCQGEDRDEKSSSFTLFISYEEILNNIHGFFLPF